LKHAPHSDYAGVLHIVSLTMPRAFGPCLTGICLLLLLVGCTTGSQVHPTTLHENLSLPSGALQRHGVAFLTPSTVTGQEQDQQTAALVFAEQMRNRLPAVHVVSLPEALGAINQAGLAPEYRKMVEAYRDTGIFPRDMLAKIGHAVGTRYLVQLKLAGFSQDMRERLSILGIRLSQTLHANIRLYMQIWDADTGAIAWEGSEEMSYAYDSSAELPVTFRRVVEEAALQLIQQLP
jgi:hypothetical protein